MTAADANQTTDARVAVIIPCYRDGGFVGDAVESVQEQEPVELVVIDDASDDGDTLTALERLESVGVRVERHEQNRGLPGARSTGLRVTRAPYVFPLDADDLAEPGMLGRMADRLDEHPEAAVCFGDYTEFGRNEHMRAVPERIDPFRLVYTNEYPVSALFRREVLESVGGWQNLEAYEDWHLWMTFAERGMTGVHFGPGVVTYRKRIHGERMLVAARMYHRRIYEQLRADHPRLFAEVKANRGESSLHPARKLLYPFVYGGRRRFAWEPRVKELLDRLGVWTVQR